MGREINLLQTFQQNLIQSGLRQLFGEPIIAASGTFLITATDFILMDIYAGQEEDQQIVDGLRKRE